LNTCQDKEKRGARIKTPLPNPSQRLPTTIGAELVRSEYVFDFLVSAAWAVEKRAQDFVIHTSGNMPLSLGD